MKLAHLGVRVKISLKWLNDFVDVQDYYSKPEALAEILTHAGHEVESIDNKSKTFDNVVIGHILEKGKHPDADRLTLCQVSTGRGVVHQIVCGAKNHNQGDRVVVALPGAILPGNFEIKKSKIRGVDSNGMLCSEVELGIADKSDGIMILSSEAPIGTPFAEYMGYDDIVFELKVTPNRSDCLSHFGLAREVSCILNRPLKEIEKKKLVTKLDTKVKIKLDVKNKESCPRYTGCFIDNVKIGDSPTWLRRRLESVGMKTINNVVDITNYVMMELGQPLHAFDYRQIHGQIIKVENSKEKEKFKTLDGTDLTLTGSELLIRDGERAVALAGVVGGLNSGINPDTTQVFVESAFFKADSVRKTARKHGIETESSYRFARGVDPEMVFTAMGRCCQLIADIAGGEIYGNPYDIYENKIQKKSISITTNYLSERLGYFVDRVKAIEWFKRLGCDVKFQADAMSLEPPLFRHDLQIADDFVEEFARLNGYEHIPETLPALTSMPTPHEKKFLLGQSVSRLMREQGFQEAIHYAFVDSKFQSEILGKVNAVSLVNPISEELNVMRASLIPSLVRTAIRNMSYGEDVGRLFETGFTFFNQNSDFIEPWDLGLVAWGNHPDFWVPKKAPLVFQIKTAIEKLIQGIGGKSWSWEPLNEVPNYLHHGQCSALKFEGKLVGTIGTLHPRIADSHKVRVEAAVAEISLDKLLQGQPRVNRVKPISRLPSIPRDLSFLMPENLSASSVIDEIQKIGKPLLVSVSVVDVFTGATLKRGEKSISFRLIYRDEKQTLSDEKIAEIQSKIISAMSQKFGIQVR